MYKDAMGGDFSKSFQGMMDKINEVVAYAKDYYGNKLVTQAEADSQRNIIIILSAAVIASEELCGVRQNAADHDDPAQQTVWRDKRVGDSGDGHILNNDGSALPDFMQHHTIPRQQARQRDDE